ncbi:MAG: hypothetical protein NXI30_01860 [bacterium]|nr:hypothetical protein [bacterium]
MEHRRDPNHPDSTLRKNRIRPALVETLLLVGALVLSTPSVSGAMGEARADVAPDGTPRNVANFGLQTFATSIGPYHVRGPGESFGEVDVAIGVFSARSRCVNFQSSNSSAFIRDSFTVVPLPGTTPSGPVTATLHLDFSGDIDLDTESGDALTPSNLSALITVNLQRLTAARGRMIDRARVLKSYAENTSPPAPSITGPRVVTADLLTTTLLGTGQAQVFVDSRVRFDGVVSIPMTAPVGTPFYFEAYLGVSMTSGEGYMTFGGFEDGGVLSIELPPGYTFNSGSGVLLSQALPEPTVAFSLAAGCALLAGRSNRSRKKPIADQGGRRAERSRPTLSAIHVGRTSAARREGARAGRSSPRTTGTTSSGRSV